jgi:hypothetical protein
MGQSEKYAEFLKIFNIYKIIELLSSFYTEEYSQGFCKNRSTQFCIEM